MGGSWESNKLQAWANWSPDMSKGDKGMGDDGERARVWLPAFTIQMIAGLRVGVVFLDECAALRRSVPNLAAGAAGCLQRYTA
jgi:hypothetical protein